VPHGGDEGARVITLGDGNNYAVDDAPPRDAPLYQLVAALGG
jgi:hypothetical protein